MTSSLARSRSSSGFGAPVHAACGSAWGRWLTHSWCCMALCDGWAQLRRVPKKLHADLEIPVAMEDMELQAATCVALRSTNYHYDTLWYNDTFCLSVSSRAHQDGFEHNNYSRKCLYGHRPILKFSSGRVWASRTCDDSDFTKLCCFHLCVLYHTGSV